MPSKEEVRALGEQMTKFPMRFAKAAIIGERPSPDQPIRVSTGTATLVQLNVGTVAITCDHVVREARVARAERPKTLFQIGDAEVDLERQLIDMNPDRDIAVILLSEDQLKIVLKGDEIGSAAFAPVSWPPTRPKQEELVSFGGFPGALREIKSFQDLSFGAWCSGASEVHSSSERQFATRFERSEWERAFGNPDHMGLSQFGGMSGGPAFVFRGMHWDLVGIVKEYHEAYDAVFFAALASVRADGTIDSAVYR
jgi:hypothetical protein